MLSKTYAYSICCLRRIHTKYVVYDLYILNTLSKTYTYSICCLSSSGGLLTFGDLLLRRRVFFCLASPPGAECMDGIDLQTVKMSDSRTGELRHVENVFVILNISNVSS